MDEKNESGKKERSYVARATNQDRAERATSLMRSLVSEPSKKGQWLRKVIARDYQFSVPANIFRVPNLFPNDILVYLELCSWASREGYSQISLRHIENDTKLNRGTVISCLDHLVEVGLVEIHKVTDANGVHDRNMYQITQPKDILHRMFPELQQEATSGTDHPRPHETGDTSTPTSSKRRGGGSLVQNNADDAFYAMFPDMRRGAN